MDPEKNIYKILKETFNDMNNPKKQIMEIYINNSNQKLIDFYTQKVINNSLLNREIYNKEWLEAEKYHYDNLGCF